MMKSRFLIVFTMLFASMHLLALQPPTNVSIANIVDYSGDCGATPSNPNETVGMIVDISVTAFADIENLPQSEVFTMKVYDAAGVPIGSRYNSLDLGSTNTRVASVYVNGVVPFPNQGIRPSPWYDTAPTARPWLIYIETQSYPSIRYGPYVVDPAEINPPCTQLPLLGVEDEPLNNGIFSNDIPIYNGNDENGSPTLQVYEVNDEGDGTLALEITQDIIAPYIDNPPSENTQLLTSADGKVTLYILDTGELQINSGPDSEGKIHVLIFDGIPPTNIYGYVIDPPLFPLS